ncbi:hypothetical protein [Brevibacterium casei]|uniref:hypothetical protein n=1 Tax=Brevibacterium casei TaxID=33889 RepID=UPI000C7818EA|nr:hypothetical protein [Brevibacterium casei]QPR39597.1 hypothetical protein I6G94_01480 [Brevibacterium casei]QPR43761.1 hypothetical protein I6G93_16765 [Brevibacterium casei]
MARTSRHGDQYKPVTDYSGVRPKGISPEARERSYARLKKASILLLLIGICGIVAYAVIALASNLLLPQTASPVVYWIATALTAICLFAGVVSLVAAPIVRLVAALKL